MKAAFEARRGECLVMVVAVHGVKPEPPRAGYSVDGCCIMVRFGTASTYRVPRKYPFYLLCYICTSGEKLKN